MVFSFSCVSYPNLSSYSRTPSFLMWLILCRWLSPNPLKKSSYHVLWCLVILFSLTVSIYLCYFHLYVRNWIEFCVFFLLFDFIWLFVRSYVYLAHYVWFLLDFDNIYTRFKNLWFAFILTCVFFVGLRSLVHLTLNVPLF